MADAKTKEPKPGFNESGERVVVTLAQLKKDFGSKGGEEVYRRVSQAAMGGAPPALPLNVDSFAPDISLAGLKPEARAEVETILTAKE